MGHYITNAKGTQDDIKLDISSINKENLTITPPPEFKGPDNFWSPEDLFSASISSCYILTFKSFALYKKMDWISISVDVDAKLEKTKDGLKFTTVIIRPLLTICCTLEIDPYLKLLSSSKDNCLVTKSMNCNFIVEPKIKVKAK